MDFGTLVYEATDSPTPEYVRAMAARGFGVTVGELMSPDRHKPLATYRMVTMAAVRSLAGTSYPATAKALGRRDHTTAMHSCQRVAEDPRLNRVWQKLCEEVRIQWSLDHGVTPPTRGQLGLPVVTEAAEAMTYVFA